MALPLACYTSSSLTPAELGQGHMHLQALTPRMVTESVSLPLFDNGGLRVSNHSNSFSQSECHKYHSGRKAKSVTTGPCLNVCVCVCVCVGGGGWGGF